MAEDAQDTEPAEGEEPRKLATSSSRNGNRTGKRRRKTAPSPPQNEEQIDSPNRQTLGMLSVVAVATLVMWGAGRAKCNYHGPGEGMQPRQVALEELTTQPKGAAFEFQHRLAAYDLEAALKFASGSAKKLVEEKIAECKKGDSCASKKAALEDKVFSKADVLERTPTAAIARTSSTGEGQEGQEFFVRLSRSGSSWKVSSYEPAKGDPPRLESGAATAPTMAVVPGMAPTAKAPSHAPAPAPPK